jgi:hypothetical protein
MYLRTEVVHVIIPTDSFGETKSSATDQLVISVLKKNTTICHCDGYLREVSVQEPDVLVHHARPQVKGGH